MPQDNNHQDRFSWMWMFATLGAFAVIVALGAAFVMGADGVNQSSEDLARSRPARSQEASPPANNVQTGPAGPSVRLVQSGAAIEIDFAACQQGQQRFDLAAGVATFDVAGRDAGDCIIDYGIDGSNPGLVTTACRVPASAGTLQFLIHDGKADMSGIATRCSEI